MSTAPASDPAQPQRTSILRNWTSLTGFVVMLGGFFSAVFLLLMDAMAPFSNPYLGILTYLVAPVFIVSGLGMILLGAWLSRRRVLRAGGAFGPLLIDLTRPKERRMFGVFLTASVVFLLISAVGSYKSYHFTESVSFCGQACHTVMEPEYVTYTHASHARVSCAECHIGKGATWYVRSKLSGAYQVYATIADVFPRPIPTPVRNLRPAQETCEQCHWPQKFVGNIERTYDYYLGDETNSHYSLRLLLKVGGADPRQGPVGGIHWHMDEGNVVEYLPADETRQKIPWVRRIGHQGAITEYRLPGFTNQVDEAKVRRMDCMDCHNRPAHRYKTPNDAVSREMALGRIDPALAYVKTNAVHVLTQPYTNKTQALQSIATHLNAQYPGDARVASAIAAVQRIYTNNFFPEMKASWKVYPENIGHKDWPGCFRCHDGRHKTADGQRVIEGHDCNACHTILAQGTGTELQQLTPQGQKFKHPGGDDVDGGCIDCHTGAL